MEELLTDSLVPPQGDVLPEALLNFVNDKFKCCLPQSVRDSLSQSYPDLDVLALKTPEADKDIMSILGKDFPSREDKRLAAVQTAILSSSAPLINLIADLIRQGFTGTDEELIPVREVLKVGKESLALIGNAANLASLKRRAGIIQAVKPKRPKLAAFLEETCLSDTVEEPSSELFGPSVKRKIADRASTIKSFNESLSCIDNAPKNKSKSRFLGRGSTARYGSSSSTQQKPYTPQRPVYRPRKPFQRPQQRWPKPLSSKK